MRLRRLVQVLAIAFVLLIGIGLFRIAADGDRPADQTQSSYGAASLNAPQATTRTLLDLNHLYSDHSVVNKLNNDKEIHLIHHNKKDKSHYYEHEVAVKFKEVPDEQHLQEISEINDGEFVKNLGAIYIFRSNSLETPELLDYFRKNESIEYAEPNFILLQNQVRAPNDVFYREKYQWNFPAIRTENGWGISRGNENITIAVVDTGVDLDHPDLRRRLTKGYNVIDDNHNPDDDNGHGTHVAGIIASETNNREGVAGLTWYSKIMPVKVLGKDGFGYTFDIAKGIVWAADNGADVINLSLGNYQPSVLLEEAVMYAYDKGVVLIAASGNDNTDQPSYPAAYNEVLSVSALSYTGELASFSNYGDYIDVTAPGVDIASTYFQKQYAALSGTSMASPHVAGLAGLILSTNPNLSNKQVMDIIKKSSYDIGKRGKDNYFGHGLIDVNDALEIANRL